MHTLLNHREILQFACVHSFIIMYMVDLCVYMCVYVIKLNIACMKYIYKKSNLNLYTENSSQLTKKKKMIIKISSEKKKS